MTIKLDIDRTLETIALLRLRINERFPDSGLSGVCTGLYEIGLQTKENIKSLAKPIWWLRISFALLISITIIIPIYIFFYNQEINLIHLYPIKSAEELESTIQILIFSAAAIFFFVKLEESIKTKRILSYLYQLRTIAHIIDMHQLTKEPKSLLATRTKNSPTRDLTNPQLLRYLDYCCELLSLTSKISALYSNDFKNALILDTINEIEDLTLGLTQKIWQKINIISKETGTKHP